VAPVADILAYALLPNHSHLITQLRAADDLPQAYREDLLASRLPCAIGKISRPRSRCSKQPPLTSGNWARTSGSPKV